MTTAAAHPQFSCSLDKNELQNFGMKAGNGDPLPDIGLLNPSTMDLPMNELRKRYNEDGYLWVSQIKYNY